MAGQFDEWVEEVHDMGKEFPLIFPDRDDVIMPQWAIKVRPVAKRPVGFQ